MNTDVDEVEHMTVDVGDVDHQHQWCNGNDERNWFGVRDLQRSICHVIAICSLEIRGSHCAIERCPAVHTYHIYNQHWRERLKPLLRSFQEWDKVYILQKFTRFGTNCAELIHSTSLG